MDKLAQKPGRINKIREKANDIWSPKMAELLADLRRIDDEVREAAKPLKGYLKAAETNFNRMEYMGAIAYLGKFYNDAEIINDKLTSLSLGVDKEHYQFLIDDLDPELKKYLIEHMSPKIEQALEKRKKKKAENIFSLIKEAGIGDWWANMTTERGKTLRAWEKRFPQYSKALKKETGIITKKAMGYLSFLLSSLKKLDSLRASHNLEGYIKETSAIEKKYQVFENEYVNFYTSHAKKFVDFQKTEQEREKKNLEEYANKALEELKKKNEDFIGKPLKNERLPFPPQRGPFKPNEQATSIEDTINPEYLDPNLTVPSNEGKKEELPIPNDVIEKAIKKSKDNHDPLGLFKKVREASYNNFLQKLSSLELSHPFVIAKEIISFANECDNENLKNKLLLIAKNMV